MNVERKISRKVGMKVCLVDKKKIQMDFPNVTLVTDDDKLD